MADYDKLTIKIAANTGSALNSIKTLSSHLDQLDQQAKRMDLGRLQEVQKCLQDIANIDFSKVSSSLYSVAKTFEQLNKSVSNAGASIQQNLDLGALEETSTSSVESVAQKVENSGKRISKVARDIREALGINIGERFSAISDYGNYIGTKLKDDFDKANESVIKLNTSLEANLGKDALGQSDHNSDLGYFEELGRAMEKIGLNGTQMESVLKTIGQETNQFSDKQIKKVAKAMKDLGYSAKQIKQSMKSLKQENNKTTSAMKNGLQKVAIKFKSLALYRVLRLALMKIQQEFSNAIQNLAQSDSGFNDAISRISSSFTYLAHSLIGSIAPILEAITPLIETIADGLAEVANLFGQIAAETSGEEKFSEATKSAEDYAESLKKVKNASLGIDELNVISQDKQESHYQEVAVVPSENGFKKVFEDLKESLGPIFDGIKEGIETLRPILETIGPVMESLKPVLEAIGNLLQAINPILQVINTLVSQLINKIAPYINKAIASIINAIASIINVIGVIIEGLQPILEIIIDVIGNVINIIADAISTIMEVISVALEPLINILKTIFTIFKPIFEVFKELYSNILNIVQKLWITVGDMLVRVLQPTTRVLNFLGGILYEIAPLLDIIATSLGLALGIGNEDNTFGRVAFGVLSLGGSELLRAGWEASGDSGYGTPSIETQSTQGTSETQGTQVNVYIDGEQVASRVNEYNENRGTTTFRRGTLSYVK